MKKLRALLLAMTLTFSVFGAQPTALAVGGLVGKSCSEGATSSLCTGTSASLGDTVKKLINTLLFVLGAVAVIVIIVGGIRYTTSDGDPGKIQSAKNVILYAVIGVIVSMLAYAIVNFVIDSLK